MVVSRNEWEPHRMNSDRNQLIEDLLEEASTLEPDKRNKFLETACGGDSKLKRAVESLLEDEQLPQGFLSKPAFEKAAGLICDQGRQTNELQPLKPNTVLQNRYQILRTISSGGMGIVYEAEDQRLKCSVALKQSFFTDSRLRRAFEREARLLAGLKHSALPKVMDHLMEDSRQFLVMEYIPGADLEEMLLSNKTPFSTAKVMLWADQLLDALEYLHTHEPPVLHRDIKPSNLKLAEQGQIVLLDFGLAKGATIAKSRVTSTGSIVGYSPCYAPLEQMQGGTTDPRSDLYALAATMYQLITNELPPDANARALAVLEGRPDLLKPANEINPQVPVAIGDFLWQSMALSRELRPGSASLMRQKLRELYDTNISPGNEQRGSTPLERRESESVFVAGPPISNPKSFFGRERELKRLFNLLKSPPMQNAVVVGSQRSGKTSLLHYLRNITMTSGAGLRPNQRSDWLSSPERYNWVFVDFQDQRLRTRAGLLQHILRSLRLPIPPTVNLDSFMEGMSLNLHTPSVILMDEIGIATQRCPELDDSFWEGLRSLATNQVKGNLAFILAGTEAPSLLAAKAGLGSPFFNIFGFVTTLGPLTELETSALISSSPIPFSDDDTDWIIATSKRWPILLQVLCRERLSTLEFGESGLEWREDAMSQIAPFLHLLA